MFGQSLSAFVSCYHFFLIFFNNPEGTQAQPFTYNRLSVQGRNSIRGEGGKVSPQHSVPNTVCLHHRFYERVVVSERSRLVGGWTKLSNKHWNPEIPDSTGSGFSTSAQVKGHQ